MKRSDLLAQQGRQPSGILGHIVARIMARETHPANLIALEHLALQPDDRLLEVGSGHGRTLAVAAQRLTKGHLVGIDPSPVMMQIARRANARAIRRGMMELVLGSSDQLPFEAQRFSKVLSVHTIYFWPNPQRDLAEIYRVMKVEGQIVIGFRPSEDQAFVENFPASVYNVRSISEVERLVNAAGFSDVKTMTKPMGKGLMAWTCGHKSS